MLQHVILTDQGLCRLSQEFVAHNAPQLTCDSGSTVLIGPNRKLGMEGRKSIPPTILTDLPITSDEINLIETLLQSHMITVNHSAERNSGFGPRNHPPRLGFVHI